MTAPQSALHREERSLAEYLKNVITEHASGRSEQECLRNYPRDVYFIGNLRPTDDEEDDPDAPPHFAELRGKIAPVANGVEFLARLEEGQRATLDVTLAFACYYRVFPTLTQQRGHQLSYALTEPATTLSTVQPRKRGLTAVEQDDEDQDDTEESPSPDALATLTDRRHRRTPKDSLFVRFRKIACKATGHVTVRITGDRLDTDPQGFVSAVSAEVARAESVAAADPERVRTSGAPWDRIDVRTAALNSEDTYAAFRHGLLTEVRPRWTVAFECSARRDDSLTPFDWTLRFEFTNTSPPQKTPEGRENPNIEAYLFDVRSEFVVKKALVLPFEVDLAPRGFRYDRSLWGRGFNCAAESLGSTQNGIRTTNTPAYAQGRHDTRVTPQARFADLAANPMPVLQAIQAAMRSYLDNWDDELARYRATSTWSKAYDDEFAKDRIQFEKEIERFETGMDVLASDSDALEAFRLTNTTFQRAGSSSNPSKRKETWRLFQIVFLVGQVPGIWALAHPTSPHAAQRELVDIIYFPTGGGKTEAYLGTWS